MGIILASASPRRLELIKKITDKFTVIPADIDETLPQEIKCEDGPEYLALKKAQHIAQSHPDDLIIGADTSVFCDGKMLGKPKDEADAADMLSTLSGRRHTVITGCALVLGDKKRGFSVATEVEFYPLTSDDISQYLKTGEPLDKAGAYGIQGKGAMLVKGIYGDYFNVVGFPVAQLSREITNFLKCGDTK